MRAFTITGPRAGHVVELPDPIAGPGEVLVAPSHVGICGTDAHIFAGRLHSNFPLVPGHELSGTVVDLHPSVRGWDVGDRVTVDPTLTCGSCYRCRRGQSNHCEEWGAIGDTVDGGLAELVRVPARNLYRLADDEPFADATFTEPVACVVWGIAQARVRAGDRAVVFGAGPVGCLMAQLLSLAGVGELVLVDVAEEKLAIAREVTDAVTRRSHPDLRAELDARTAGRGFDLVVDCTGSADVIARLGHFAGPGARILLFGVAPPEASMVVSPYRIYRNDWQIIGSMAINGTFGRARDLMTSGRLKVRPLVTRTASLADVPDILAAPKPSGELKVMVVPGGADVETGADLRA